MTEAQEAFYAQGELGLTMGFTVSLLLCFVLGVLFVRGLR